MRLYGRALTMFKPGPGAESATLVPDLAETLGVTNDGGKTWTYKLREGVKYEDGTAITSEDVKYGVLRTVGKETLVNGPTYFGDFLDFPADYKGPFETPDMNVDSAITTPDDRTIVFHLKSAFSGFDYLGMLPGTIPVPKAKDTGVRYKETVVSSGPYKFESYEEGVSFVLVRNENWDAATDPNRPALPDRYEVSLGVEATDIDQQIINGSIHVDLAGTGVQPATLSQVLTDEALKANADNPLAARLWYTSINPKVAPLDNIECRKAVLYATDRTGYQAAYGGPFAGGEIATTLMPPMIPGYTKFDLYPAGADNKGDVEKAKAALTACGQPNGFATKMAFRGDRPKEQATAESLQQSLARVGIQLTLVPIPTSEYFSTTVGVPSYRDGQRHRPGHQRLGRRLERRLRLPVADRRQPDHPGHRWLVEPVGLHPRGRPDDRPGAGRGRRRGPRQDLGRGRQAGHGGGGHPAGCLLQGAHPAGQGPDQRVHQRRVRPVRLHDARPRVVSPYLVTPLHRNQH